mgnify:CR=1 FL=1|tara:strand:- start:154 stop:345 length:192 start_codon:yes stop_codon:yes gene_type:complete
MREKSYYYYDHVYGEGGYFKNFGELMDFIDNAYDKDRHTIQDSWESHVQVCKENDNPIEEVMS